MKNLAAVKYRIFLIVSSFLLCLLCALPVRAVEKVRVGCVDIGDFIQIDQDGYAIGYGAEYLNKIAEYAGWEYEYIQAPWGECLDMLRRGELDLLLPAEYSEERAKDFLFSSYECCFDFAALVGRKSDGRLYYDDYQGFQGIRVGMIKDNFLNDLFDEYAKNHGFSYEPVYYDTGTQIVEALEREEVDAIINGNMEYNMNQKLLAKIDYMPAYFITSVNKPGLMVRLNKALKQIFIDNPYYSAGLYEKYYHEMDRQFAEFTREESQFVKQSGPVTVLVARSDYPFEWYDEKEKTCRGAFVDYMRHLSVVSGLNFEFIPLDQEETSSDELFQGNAQIRLSVFKQRRSRASGSLKFTIPYYECSFSLVGKKDEPLNLSSHQRISMVEKVDGLKEVLADKYPHWEIVACDTPKDCLTAVENGTADCAMVSSIKLSADRNLLGMNLVVVDGSTAVAPVYIGVSDNANPLLAQVLSKSIAKAGKGAMDEAVYTTLLSGKESKDFSYFIQTYPLYFAFGVIAMSLLGVGILFMRYDARHQKLQNLILQKRMRN
ncbi:MAG: transporter substrate-binding domain-containing protein [Clostridia bacterium]|nr:transporter substrate-binding domain-containing protein [Clostridia bacterium]